MLERGEQIQNKIVQNHKRRDVVLNALQNCNSRTNTVKNAIF